MSADSYNSDDERYADDTFEQESDTDVPEVAEIESEISEVSDEYDDDRLPSVKMNTGPIRRTLNYTKNIITAPTNTDSVPFDSSSDEEDDVIVGQTLAEINTPSMHFEESQKTPPMRREIRPVRYESSHRLKSLDEDESGSSVSEEEDEDSDDEKEFQRIREMEERYLLQSSAKTKKASIETFPIKQVQDEKLTAESSDEQETEAKSPKGDAESFDEQETYTKSPTGDANLEPEPVQNDTTEPGIDPIPELIERVMESFTPKPQVPAQIQKDFMEIVQNSLASLQTDNESANERTPDTLITSDIPTDDSIRMTFNFEPNNILNPENIAMAFFDAINATNATFANNNSMTQTLPRKGTHEEEYENTQDSAQTHNNNIDSNKRESNGLDAEHGDKEEELEHQANASPSPLPDDYGYDDEGEEDYESYYNTQFEYRITSKTPSCFNSEDYVFHANFIRPTPSTEKLRARPQPRKSMSFSNERMREIERHNQILLRKILTQKPTYVSKSAQHKVQSNKATSQTNARLTTSAVNRKKQQRQIDLDNQVLKRKIEAVANRRRPLIT